VSETRRPRVLFLALETFSRVGGIQRFSRRIISALAGISGDDTATHLMGDNPADLPANLPGVARAFGRSRLRFIAASLRRARSSDVLLATHINLLPVAALCKLINPRLRVILFAHGDEVWGDPQYRERRWYDRPALSLVDCVAAVSAHTARRMGGAFGLPPARFDVFPNAVDDAAHAAGRRDGRRVLAVSRLDAHDQAKNFDKLVAAFADVRRRVPGAMLEIIGDGVLRPDLSALADRLGLNDAVIFHGRVDDVALEEAYSRADVFALPSSKEGFGIVFLEAWQHGLPVVCGTEDAASEIVADGVDGFAVDPADAAQLAERLSFLLEHPEAAAEMGRRGAAKVREHYTMARFTTNLRRLVGADE
jgi:phosphatidylinositol alpha-1,6-mannosyltransferase